MQPERTFFVDGDGVKILVAEWPGRGEPLLCVHGLTANHICFELLAEGLVPEHRVLALDLRGRGRSDQPATGYSLENHCRDIAAVIRGLGLTRVNYAGHSLGAYIGLALAAWYPELVQRLILIDGGADLSKEQWEKVSAGIGPSVDRLGKFSPDAEAYFSQVRQTAYFSDWNPTMQRYFRYEIEELPQGVCSRVDADAIAEERANLSDIDPAELHPLVRCPVLVLRAAKGMVEPDRLLLPPDAVARMVGAMPGGARVVDLAGADHFSILFQPNPARDQAVREFLAEPL